ncbi:MAG: hypothetical protein JW797_00270 [Bradymonadales bacterium]|nr:hypothetical protein [Bradymonadales bacterium]
MDLVDLIESCRFLGGEFLTWLWFACDQQEGRFVLPDIGSVEIAFDDQLVLEAFLTQTERSRLSGGNPIDSPEAKIALKAGKRVSKAKLRLTWQEREWLFSVDARQFDFTGVKVPAVLSEHSEQLIERLTLIDELVLIWRTLYGQFLELRLADSWERTEQEIADWIASEATP